MQRLTKVYYIVNGSSDNVYAIELERGVTLTSLLIVTACISLSLIMFVVPPILLARDCKPGYTVPLLNHASVAGHQKT